MLQHFKIAVFIREKTQTIKEYRKKKNSGGERKDRMAKSPIKRKRLRGLGSELRSQYCNKCS